MKQAQSNPGVPVSVPDSVKRPLNAEEMKKALEAMPPEVRARLQGMAQTPQGAKTTANAETVTLCQSRQNKQSQRWPIRWGWRWLLTLLAESLSAIWWIVGFRPSRGHCWLGSCWESLAGWPAFTASQNS